MNYLRSFLAAFLICFAPLFTKAQFCYSVSSIAYAPDPFNSGTNLGLNVDDVFSSAINLPFPFCFNGVTYNQVLISTNGYLSFNLGMAGAYSDWMINGPIPANTPSTITNAIMGPWEDLDITVGGTIRYTTYGAAPSRRFVVSYKNVKMYQCNGKELTSQITLYETSNNIDIILNNMEHCPNGNMWNNNWAVEGINNAAGNAAYAIAGRNATIWGPLTNDAYRFTSCASCAVLTIELTSFTVERNSSFNRLAWETASERNNDYFILERSSDAVNYTEIARVKSTGSENVPASYFFPDTNPKKGINYYRLQTVDKDGVRDISSVQMIDNSELVKVADRIFNMMGREVSAGSPGIIFIHYTDGSVERRVNQD